MKILSTTTTPSGITNFSLKVLIASLTYEPIFPSIIPGLNPLFDKYVCISDTESKFAPVLSLPYRYSCFTTCKEHIAALVLLPTTSEKSIFCLKCFNCRLVLCHNTIYEPGLNPLSERNL